MRLGIRPTHHPAQSYEPLSQSDLNMAGATGFEPALVERQSTVHPVTLRTQNLVYAPGHLYDEVSTSQNFSYSIPLIMPYL